MLTLKQIQAESREAAIVAASERQTPLVVWPEDVATPEVFEALAWRIPYLGTYEPSGWQPIGVDTLTKYSYKWFFVDSSGLGHPDEAALTIEGFRLMLKAICETHGYRYGIAVVEAGEFQVQIGLFENLKFGHYASY